ncbi:MAG TPA: Type 1 glutamine amidotransferase-like domain-containing protein [Acidobacteriota bacterium]|nr:Type 1 glutamine amidotransferase-like domain-containing protein [Acidobacteriota bacterium]
MNELGVSGPLCAITAGWQEREGELEELCSHVGCEVIDLELYQRADGLFRADQKLVEEHRSRQEKLIRLQRLYRIRLHYALEAVRALNREESAPQPSLLRSERQAALNAVRALDRRHLRRVVKVHQQNPELRLRNSHVRNELEEIITASQAVLVAGGHIATLLNRIRLFDLKDLISQRPVIAWSAGAMAMSEHILLFHDCPPQGAGDAELLETGLGLVEGVVPLPNARSRLLLDDRERVGRLARRMKPMVCATLEQGSLLHWRQSRLLAARRSWRLTSDGKVRPIQPAD